MHLVSFCCSSLTHYCLNLSWYKQLASNPAPFVVSVSGEDGGQMPCEYQSLTSPIHFSKSLSLFQLADLKKAKASESELSVKTSTLNIFKKKWKCAINQTINEYGRDMVSHSHFCSTISFVIVTSWIWSSSELLSESSESCSDADFSAVEILPNPENQASFALAEERIK